MECGLQSLVLKCSDSVHYKIATLMYKIKNNMVSVWVQNMFEIKSISCKLGGSSMFVKPKVQINVKYKITDFICARCECVELLEDEFKSCASVCIFKRKFKAKIMNSFIRGNVKNEFLFSDGCAFIS